LDRDGILIDRASISAGPIDRMVKSG